MRTTKMKGKNVEEAIESACAVLGVAREQITVRVISEGKPAVLGVIGGELAEVEVSAKGEAAEEAKQVLQDLLDKMEFLAVVESAQKDGEETIALSIKGEDMGRIIGKEGATLKALEILVGSILWKLTGERFRIAVDAGGYREKRVQALQRLADEIVAEVEESGQEKTLPYMEASDRRTIHLYLQNNPKVTTYSKGEGRDRKMVVAPR